MERLAMPSMAHFVVAQGRDKKARVVNTMLLVQSKYQQQQQPKTKIMTPKTVLLFLDQGVMEKILS